MRNRQSPGGGTHLPAMCANELSADFSLGPQGGQRFRVRLSEKGNLWPGKGKSGEQLVEKSAKTWELPPTDGDVRKLTYGGFEFGRGGGGQRSSVMLSVRGDLWPGR